MLNSKSLWFTVLIFSIATSSLWNCTSTLSGTEVTNEKSIVYMPGGSGPAALAQVSFFPVDYTPGAGATEDVFQTETDKNGVYTLPELPSGYYNLIAAKQQFALYRDSVYIGEQISSRKDTLGLPGSVSARVKLQPNHDPRTVYVQVLGTEYYENVNSAGYFTLSDLPQGTYRLRLSTTLTDYTPTFVKISVASGRADTVPEPFELVYTGIPVVTGLKAVYNPVSKTVQLSWKAESYPFLEEYVVYRENLLTDAEPHQLARVKSSFYVDSLALFAPDSGYTDVNFRYKVAIKSSSSITGVTCEHADVTITISRSSLSLFASDTVRFSPGIPFLLHLEVDSSFGSISNYSLALGDQGFLKVSGPDTNLTIDIPGDSLVTGMMCRAQITSKDGIKFTDTLILQSRMTWEKKSEIFMDGCKAFHASVLGNELFVFAASGPNDALTWSVWKSMEGITWTKEVDSLPFRITLSPLVFQGKIRVWERDESMSHPLIWSSDNGRDWFCDTLEGLTNAGYSSDYDVWSAIEDKLVLFNYYPLCLQNVSCSGELRQSWSSLDGLTWQIETMVSSVFPDRYDTPNKNFKAVQVDGNLVVAGAWRALYLTYPVYTAYSVRIWNAFNSEPVKIGFPQPTYQSAPDAYNPQLIGYKNRLYLSAQINMSNSVSPQSNTDNLWVLMKDKWFLCSDVFPAVRDSGTNSDYHALCVFKDDLYSISNAGVWVLNK